LKGPLVSFQSLPQLALAETPGIEGPNESVHFLGVPVKAPFGSPLGSGLTMDWTRVPVTGAKVEVGQLFGGLVIS
jgi:hypothetical protein